MNYFMGLDGGGTKTAACLLDSEGREMGRGLGGPCNIATGDDAMLSASVQEAGRGALAAAGLNEDTPLTAVCAGVAGYTAKRRRADFARLLSEITPAEHHFLEPDFVVAYWGATKGEPGIIACAGTGAVVYGRNAAGQECRVDGRGFLLGDRGSGFGVGQAVLKRLIGHWDQDGTGDRLSDFDRKIMAGIGAQDADDVIEWAYRDFQPARIASLAAIVGELAAEGDEWALEVLYNEGSRLRFSVNRVIQRLELPTSTPVYTLGSLWNIEKGFHEGFHRSKHLAPSPSLSLHPPLHDAVYGAALLAMQRAAANLPLQDTP